MNVTTTEAELFAIRYGINQATNLNGINKIIVITDSIYVTKKNFDSSSHPFQIYIALISDEFGKFFAKSHDNIIEF